MSNKSAADAYTRQHHQRSNPRETEGRALLEMARRMAEAQKTPEDRQALRETVRVNWRLWTIFQAELAGPDCAVPPEIRGNMLNLCNFVDKRTVDILAQPSAEKLTVLININRQIGAGLLTDPPQDPEDSRDDAGGRGMPGPGGGLSI